MISSLNNNVIDFRISYDESDDEDYTVIFDKNSFSYKIISANDFKTYSENDNEKVNMPLFPSPEPTVSYFDDLDFFKDFENEFPAIVYNDALTDEKEQNVLYFNDLFPFNVIYPDDLKPDKDNDIDEIDIEQSSRDMYVVTLPNVINTDDGAYALRDRTERKEEIGFEDPEFSDKVYKRGQIDKTLFIKRIKSDILLVQVYVDDIIFGSATKEFCTDFEKLMHKKFQMSSMGELTFFLGL
ncbi:putative reverse transcriptase domain-containing protein [Tanacetum coccineum]